MDFIKCYSKKTVLIFILLLNSMMVAFDSPKILIKIPTRSRPDRFFKYLDQYYNKLSNKYPCCFLISCDLDDATMNNKLVIDKLLKYPNLFFYFSVNKSKIEAHNRDIEKHLDFDIFIMGTDDTWPEVKGYDEIIVQAMWKHFPDFDVSRD